ncbi:hypothetical protein NP493_751g01001 [Ridgeia piscesae]|uniref:VWFD domain-containing protein n=1 Tax=Ridgeia piscesae TaxID=27915 RepID=A0AAD9KPP9_RIDPI|nr:hypothetical protein NP493_751g01001 [Ridgeia piscesae]
MDATVFSAFAAKDSDSDTVHIGMNATRDGLAIFVENEDITSWFTSADLSAETDYTGVTLTKKTAKQIEVAFTSMFTLTIGVNAEQLDITVGASSTFHDKTKGLMGVFNGNATDDLLPPGENAVALSNSSSEKTIFFGFGEKWRIEKIDSLFYYASGESYSTYAHTEFQPLFLEDVLNNMTESQRTAALNTCGENKECLFDLAVTGKEEAAAATLATNSKNEKSATALANASPNITVDSVFNVTQGQQNTLTVTTSDPDGDTVAVTLESPLPTNASFEKNTYTWTPDDMNPVNISFSASDGNEGVAAADVTINMCYCFGHGNCLFDLLAEGYELKHTFRIVQCNCSIGWEGDHCEFDLDGCQDNPCTAGTNCSDVTPEEQVIHGKSYNCSECPAGTEDNEGICLPINECDPSNKRHDCAQVCIDQTNGFTCTCDDGYRLDSDGKNCSDVNECSESTSGCEQECENTQGSFVCSCLDGYQLNADNKSCTFGKSLSHYIYSTQGVYTRHLHGLKVR